MYLQIISQLDAYVVVTPSDKTSFLMSSQNIYSVNLYSYSIFPSSFINVYSYTIFPSSFMAVACFIWKLKNME